MRSFRLWIPLFFSPLIFFGCASTQPLFDSQEILFDRTLPYASYSKINDGTAILYAAGENANGKTVCLNAGHGTKKGTQFQTLCHPDGSPKVMSGSTLKGATTAVAVSAGTTMRSGIKEATVNLRLARIVRDELLARGFHVLMIRDARDVQLDNIARTVLANAHADCHIALHYDSTDTDKGAFFLSIPEDAAYKAMEPVATWWQAHESLGRCLITSFRANGIAVYGSGEIPMDLTQTSYSTIPSVDLEVGDRASRYAKKKLRTIARAVGEGLDSFFFAASR